MCSIQYYMYSMGFFSSCRNIEQKSLNLTPRLIFCKWRRRANHAKETLYFQRLETFQVSPILIKCQRQACSKIILNQMICDLHVPVLQKYICYKQKSSFKVEDRRVKAEKLVKKYQLSNQQLNQQNHKLKVALQIHCTY